MSDDRPCPAHFAYGLAVTFALALGFLLGMLAQPAPPPAAPASLPEQFSVRFNGVEGATRRVMKRQELILKRLGIEWDPYDE